MGADGTESGGDSQCKVTPGCALLAQPIYDRTHGTEHRLIPAVGPGFPLPATSHRTAAESVVCVQGLQLFQSTLNVSPHRYTCDRALISPFPANTSQRTRCDFRRVEKDTGGFLREVRSVGRNCEHMHDEQYLRTAGGHRTFLIFLIASRSASTDSSPSLATTVRTWYPWQLSTQQLQNVPRTWVRSTAC